MKIEHMKKEVVAEMVLKVLKKYLSLKDYKVFFFGSRVDGTSNERSDIDIGIKGRKELDLSTLAEIKSEIEELPILYSIDIVDFKNCSDQFKKVAGRHIEPLTQTK